MVIHNCDIKACVNIDHLYLGTRKDNARDAIERGQMPKGERHGTHTHPERWPRGSGKPNAKLSPPQLLELRSLYKPKTWTLRDLASKYGTSISTISRVLRGDSYSSALNRSEPTKSQTGSELISAERKRQIEKDGYDAKHDDIHKSGEILKAAIAYASTEVPDRGFNASALDIWPWEFEYFKNENPLRNLVKAGALIAAEIDRLNRSETEEGK